MPDHDVLLAQIDERRGDAEFMARLRQRIDEDAPLLDRLADECLGCGEGDTPDCPHSGRQCGHHCNHTWTHDHCHWCDVVFGADGASWREVTQTILYDPELEKSGITGNCFQAAVASVMRLPLEAVPHFVTFTWWAAALELWLRGRQLTYTEVETSEIPDRVCIVSGPSPRGVDHSVVGCAGEVVWDPHPSRAGLASVTHVMTFEPWPNGTHKCYLCGAVTSG